MRGPGPKWHAKHTTALLAAAGVQPATPNDAPRARATAVPSSVMTWIAPTAAAAALGFMAVMMLA